MTPSNSPQPVTAHVDARAISDADLAALMAWLDAFDAQIASIAEMNRLMDALPVVCSIPLRRRKRNLLQLGQHALQMLLDRLRHRRLRKLTQVMLGGLPPQVEKRKPVRRPADGSRADGEHQGFEGDPPRGFADKLIRHLSSFLCCGDQKEPRPAESPQTRPGGAEDRP